MGEENEASSGGTFKVTIFPSEQLGKAFDGYTIARDGVADISVNVARLHTGPISRWRCDGITFLISSGDGGSHAVDEWYRKYAPREMSDTHYCIGFVHDPGALHLAKKKVLAPDDMKGLKIRPAGARLARSCTSSVQPAFKPRLRSSWDSGPRPGHGITSPGIQSSCSRSRTSRNST